MNGANGTTLYGKAADTRRSTGSTTKIMTALVVLQQPKLDLDAKVTIQKAYSDYIVENNWASNAKLIVGDKVTVRQLLYGLMLPSGCDAAYALADRFGTGTTRAARVKSFIGKMNATARSLGLKNTHFDSFDGIGKGANYSTPRDLTKLAGTALKNSTFRTIVKTKKYTAKTVTKSGGTRTMAPGRTPTRCSARTPAPSASRRARAPRPSTAWSSPRPGTAGRSSARSWPPRRRPSAPPTRRRSWTSVSRSSAEPRRRARRLSGGSGVTWVGVASVTGPAHLLAAGRVGGVPPSGPP